MGSSTGCEVYHSSLKMLYLVWTTHSQDRLWAVDLIREDTDSGEPIVLATVQCWQVLGVTVSLSFMLCYKNSPMYAAYGGKLMNTIATNPDAPVFCELNGCVPLAQQEIATLYNNQQISLEYRDKVAIRASPHEGKCVIGTQLGSKIPWKCYNLLLIMCPLDLFSCTDVWISLNLLLGLIANVGCHV